MPYGWIRLANDNVAGGTLADKLEMSQAFGLAGRRVGVGSLIDPNALALEVVFILPATKD